MNFVTVDEVGEEDEEEVTHSTRGRPPKRTKEITGNTHDTHTQPRALSRQ